MTDATTDVVVRRAVTVAAPVERAFTVFTEDFDAWWPASHHIGAAPPVLRTLEAGPDGRWFERAADGTECDWGRVRVWEPPHRLVLSWTTGADWKPDPDPAHWSEVEVLFSAVAGGTRVDLEHRFIGRLGDGASSIFEGVSHPDYGHPFYLRRFAAAAEGRPVG
jgi:uncharacterized protein YndB with AHSA1/START domain